MEETGAAIVDELISIADEKIQMVVPASGDDVIFLGNGIFSWKRYVQIAHKWKFQEFFMWSSSDQEGTRPHFLAKTTKELCDS